MAGTIEETIITSTIDNLFALAEKGIKYIVNLKHEARKKLKAVYLEVNANKTLLEKTAGRNGEGVRHGTKEFSRFAKELTTTETAPLFKENKTIRRSRIVKGGSKREKINRIQYALNYTVRQIGELKALAKQKTVTGLRLSVRLRTLAKHLAELEKVLCLVK